MKLKYVIKQILNEELKVPVKVKSFAPLIDKLINEKLKNDEIICEKYVMDEFIQILSEFVVDEIFYFFSLDLLSDKEQNLMMREIYNYIDLKWNDFLENFYSELCDENLFY
jgi:hypothetical protein